jgi:alpha-L-arabinofuranosidase
MGIKTIQRTNMGPWQRSGRIARELGHKNVEDYIEIAREAAKAMKAVDNSIKLVACGSSWYSQDMG